MSDTPPFLRVEIKGENGETLVLTRETLDASQVKIETSARVIFCPPSGVRAALEAMTIAEAEALKGN